MPARKIKLRTAVAGRGYTYTCGQVVDLPAEVAQRYVDAKQATYEDDEPKKSGKPPAKRSRKATSKKAKTSQKR